MCVCCVCEWVRKKKTRRQLPLEVQVTQRRGIAASDAAYSAAVVPRIIDLFGTAYLGRVGSVQSFAMLIAMVMESPIYIFYAS